MARPRAQAAEDGSLAMILLGLEGARAFRQRDYPTALARWSERLRLAEAHGDDYVAADAEFDLANVAWRTSDLAAMRFRLDRASDAAYRLGNANLVGLVLVLQANLLLGEGDRDKARASAERAVEAGAARVDQHSFYFVSVHAGGVLRAVGAYGEAEAVLTRMIEAAVVGHRVHEAAEGFLELGRLLLATDRREKVAEALRGLRLLLGDTGGRLEREWAVEKQRLIAGTSKNVATALLRRVEAPGTWTKVLVEIHNKNVT